MFFNRCTEDTDENRSDRVGLFDRFTPKFAKSYLNLSKLLLKVLAAFREEVLRGDFPTDQHSFHVDEKELSQVIK